MGALLHLELHIVEYAIEVDWVEFDGHLYCRVLLEVDKRLLTLFWVNHASCSLDSLSLIDCNFFAIKHHELNQAFYHNHSIIRFPCDRIVQQREIEQVWKLCKFLNFEKFLDSVIRDVERLKLFKLLNIS